MTTWGHHARRLTAAEVDRFDRWGEVCATSPTCTGQATTMICYEYVTGRARRTTTANKRACDRHADAFATKHDLTIGAAPTVEPRTPGILAAAADAWTPGPVDTVTLRGTGHQWAATCHSRNGTVQTSNCWLDDMPGHLPLDDVLPRAETALARQHRLVRTGPWRRLGDRTATVTVAKAEDTERWADARWAVAVAVDATACYDGARALWSVSAVLAAQFKVETWPLGHTNMDLDRAIRTTPMVMGDAWELGEWTVYDAGSATTTARCRKQAPDAA